MNAEPGYLLVVEDVPDILELLEETLKFKGYRVVTATMMIRFGSSMGPILEG